MRRRSYVTPDFRYLREEFSGGTNVGMSHERCHIYLSNDQITQIFCARRNPDLDRMHELSLGVIPLAVNDSAARRHCLHFVGPENVAFACAVAMAQSALEHIRNDFHVAVSVRPEAFAGRDSIVVEHTQDAEIRKRRIVVVRERKRVVSFQPSALGVSTLITFAYFDHCFRYVKCWEVTTGKRTPPGNRSYVSINSSRTM